MADSDNDSLATLVPQDASEEEEPLAAEQETEEELQSLEGLKKKARKEIRLKETMILSLELMKEEPVTSANVWEYVDVTKDAQNDVAYVKTKRMGDSDKKNVEIKMYNMKGMRSIYQASESDTADHVYDDLIKSLKKGPLKRTGAGKSGSKMYWSADKQVIVKSLSPIEVSKGKYFMKDYCEYMRSVDSSFLVKYYCLVRVRRGTSLDYYIVMRNTFPPGFIPKTVYDLKGSLHGRRGEKDGLMKDLDFVEQSPQFQFSDGPQKAQFLAQLIDDLAFLKNNKIIDYSALIGNDGEVWHMGIIDIMTPYTQKKKGEYKVFGFLHGKEKISCNPPDNYAYRFFNFLVKGLLKD